MFKKLLFKFAKGTIIGEFVGTAFRYGSWAIPVKKVYNGKGILAFYHPCPSYENHIIISPKRAIKNLQQMELECYSKYFVQIFEVTKDISMMHPEYNDSFAIVANGGKRQEVQQVHFHMFTNHEIVKEYFAGEQAEGVVYSDRDICILEHPEPNWEIQFVIQSNAPFPITEKEKERYFRSVLHGIDLLDDEFDIVQRGYSLIYRCGNMQDSDKGAVFHVVSGRKTKDI